MHVPRVHDLSRRQTVPMALARCAAPHQSRQLQFPPCPGVSRQRSPWPHWPHAGVSYREHPGLGVNPASLLPRHLQVQINSAVQARRGTGVLPMACHLRWRCARGALLKPGVCGSWCLLSMSVQGRLAIDSKEAGFPDTLQLHRAAGSWRFRQIPATLGAASISAAKSLGTRASRCLQGLGRWTVCSEPQRCRRCSVPGAPSTGCSRLCPKPGKHKELREHEQLPSTAPAK